MFKPLYMKPTTKQKELIDSMSQLLYNWRNRNDIDNILFDELILQEVADMDILYTDKMDAIRSFITLLKIIKTNG